jgi:choline kinase
VVINAAGLGSRLGLNLPKSLVEVGGRSLLAWQLELLEDVDVVVVAGFRAEAIIDYLRQRRPDVPIVLNHDFRSTGTAASLALGARVAGDWVVSLDGDLLVAPESLGEFTELGPGEPRRLVGLTPRSTDTPVGAIIDDNGDVADMGFTVESAFEWSGLVRLPRSEAMALGRGHVFESLLPRLPLPSTVVDCAEIDEPGDVAKAELWIARHTELGEWTRAAAHG